MQQPTLQSVRVRSTRDALQVFYGVATNKLPLITRRLDAEERRAIVAGNVYVWEERNSARAETIGIGMERWTDGLQWGPSRVRDEFLFYHQKESDIEDHLLSPVSPWAQLLRGRETSSNSGGSPSSQPERLVKQTYSVYVSLPADRAHGIVRKWHLTAYFSQERLSRLRTIDSIPGIGNVEVPEGLFRNARNKPRRDSQATMTLPGGSSSASIRPAISHHAGTAVLLSESPTVAPSTLLYSPNSSSAANPESFQTLPEQLVPLQYLQSASSPRRDPVDEQFLRRFNNRGLVRNNSSTHPSARLN
ncbi:Gti1/Pac2 family-domain-containing protein [Rhodocollybia butyracea]|uniref:Gti1/Pac2 family-domain-containing protein n=1 Tax=Rhodocollybia butyracea TaxID=206335 RepID=A0A9P5PT78_9AGAR|nr:Gti1/Pac2 family-domain-containing protein [Rhodocollybia butyracea]